MSVYNPSGSGNVHIDKVIGNKTKSKPQPLKKQAPVKAAPKATKKTPKKK